MAYLLASMELYNIYKIYGQIHVLLMHSLFMMPACHHSLLPQWQQMPRSSGGGGCNPCGISFAVALPPHLPGKPSLVRLEGVCWNIASLVCQYHIILHH